jgi:hypothetical protein
MIYRNTEKKFLDPFASLSVFYASVVNTDIEIEIPSCLIEIKLHTICVNYLPIKVEIVVRKMFYFDVTPNL